MRFKASRVKNTAKLERFYGACECVEALIYWETVGYRALTFGHVVKSDEGG